MESLGTLILGMAMGWLLRDIVDDQFKRRSYAWLINHYLLDPELRSKADKSHLTAIEMKGGCSKGTFRRLIMRPIFEKYK